MPTTDVESVSWLRFIFASITVIGLMALLGWALKYFSMRGWIRPGGRSAGAIQLLSSFPLDARRRLVIAKCEDIEYHLLLGPNNDVVLSRKFTAPPSDSDPSDSCPPVV